MNNRLYPESLWLQKAVSWAEDSAERFGLPDHEHIKESLADELVALIGEPDFITGSLDTSNADKQLMLLMDLIEWLSLSLDQSGSEPKLDMNCEVINALAQQNPGVFVAIRLLGDYPPKGTDPKSDKFIRYVTAVLQCLKHADDAGSNESAGKGGV